ncbi:MAG TPA: glycoside hydrolase family 15 protein [Actinomycetota bacterium]|nr:glycoside hydrolase family 15 protein [Actinomycetota bacterium]
MVSAPRIEDYAFIGDTSSGALVSKDGSMDWLCLPRFDSAAVFAALLDEKRAGRWSIRPAGEFRSSRRYAGDTLILESRFETDEGTAVLVDCLPVEPSSEPRDPRAVIAEGAVCRQVRGERGAVRMSMDYRPRFDYGSIVPWFRNAHGAIEAVGGPDALDLLATIDLEVGAGSVTAEFLVEEGETVSFVASYHPSYTPVEPRRADECAELIANTRDFWERWVNRCTYEGRWRDEVVRSLLTLKALTFAPSGGVAAAATTSLPEQIGGPRNWDYRYCWLRDATFTLDVLLEDGYTQEAAEWRDWLLRAVAGDPEDLQIMYGLVGERRLHEVELDWLNGYESSRPVRIGNAAFDQFQLDVYGEVMDSLYSARRAGIAPSGDAWQLQQVLVEFVCERWTDPDEGIWEVRSGRRHFVHSKVMAWVAVDRAIKTVEEYGREGDVERWRQTRDAIRAEVMERGIHDGRFKRAYDEDQVDASLLMLPLVGFIDAADPVMEATIEAVQNDLMRDGFLLRYESAKVADGLPPGEGAFLMCTFWLVDCLVLLGRQDEAVAMFERLLEVRNDVGLLAEQYDPHDERLLGNFPQAFSHVALVASARALETAGAARSVSRGQHTPDVGA